MKKYRYIKNGVEKTKTVSPETEAAFLEQARKENITVTLVSDGSGNSNSTILDEEIVTNRNSSDQKNTVLESEDGSSDLELPNLESLESQSVGLKTTPQDNPFWPRKGGLLTTEESVEDETQSLFYQWQRLGEQKKKDATQLDELELKLVEWGDEYFKDPNYTKEDGTFNRDFSRLKSTFTLDSVTDFSREITKMSEDERVNLENDGKESINDLMQYVNYNAANDPEAEGIDLTYLYGENKETLQEMLDTEFVMDFQEFKSWQKQQWLTEAFGEDKDNWPGWPAINNVHRNEELIEKIGWSPETGFNELTSDAYQEYKERVIKEGGRDDTPMGNGKNLKTYRTVKDKVNKAKQINELKQKAELILLDRHNSNLGFDEKIKTHDNGGVTEEFEQFKKEINQEDLLTEINKLRYQELEQARYDRKFEEWVVNNGDNWVENAYYQSFSTRGVTDDWQDKAKQAFKELDENQKVYTNKINALNNSFMQMEFEFEKYGELSESLQTINNKITQIDEQQKVSFNKIKPELDVHEETMTTLMQQMEELKSVQYTTDLEYNQAKVKYDQLAKEYKIAEKAKVAIIEKYRTDNADVIKEYEDLTTEYDNIVGGYKNSGGRTYDEINTDRITLVKHYDRLMEEGVEMQGDSEELKRFMDATGRNYGLFAVASYGFASALVNSGASLLEIGHKIQVPTIIAKWGKKNIDKMPDWAKPLFTSTLSPFSTNILDKQEQILDTLWEMDQGLATRIKKPIQFSEIETAGDAIDYFTHLTTTQSVNTAIVFTCPYALTVLGSMSAGSAFHRMDEEQKYYDQLPEDHPMHGFEYSMSQQYAVSILGGLAEGVSEKFSVGQAKYFKNMLRQGGLKRGMGEFFKRNLMTKKGLYVNLYMPLEEGMTEGLAQISQNWLDRSVSGNPEHRHKSLWENVPDALVGGIFMSKFIYGAPNIGNNLRLAFQSTDATIELQNISKEIIDYSKKLEQADLDPKVKKHYENKIQELVFKHSQTTAETVGNIDKMTQEEKNSLINIDVSIAALKQANFDMQIDFDNGKLSEADLKAEQAKNNEQISIWTATKNQIIAKASKSDNVSQIERNTKNLQNAAKKIFGDPNAIIPVDNSNVSSELQGLIDSEVSVIDKKIKNYQQQIADLSGRSRNIANQDKVRELKEKIEGLKDDKKSAKSLTVEDVMLTHGVTAPNSGKILINTNYAAEKGATSVAEHEFLHKVFMNTLADNPQAAVVLSNALDSYLQDIGMTETVAQSEYAARLMAYQDAPQSIRAEEKITLFLDALKRGDIKIKKTGNKVFKNAVRRILQSTGLQDVKLNTAEDVYNFITDYAHSTNSIFYNKAIAKGAREGFKIGDKLIQKYSSDTNTKVAKAVKASKDGNYELSESIVNDIGLSYSAMKDIKRGEGDRLWKEDSKERGRDVSAGYKTAMDIMTNGKMFDGLILSSTSIPIPKALQEKFLNDVYTELNSHVRNFNPESNDDLYGWIASQIKNKTLNVQKRPEYSPDRLSRAKDIDERTDDGAPIVQPVADNTSLDNFIDNIGLTPYDQELTSELRQDINLTPEMMDKVRQAVMNTFKNNLPDFNSPEFQKELKKQYVVFLSDQIKKYLGTSAKHEQFLKDNREAIVKNLTMADLVSMERLQDNKIFGKQVKKLTTKDEIQKAVDNNLLPPEALNKKQAWLYEKIIPTEKQFMDFFFPPLIHPVTGKKDNTRGERKKSLSQRLAVALAFDATMETIQDPDNVKTIDQVLKHNNKKALETQLSIIGQQIGRSPYLKFSKDIDLSQIEDLFTFVNELGYENAFVNGKLLDNIKTKEFSQVNIDLVNRIFEAENIRSVDGAGYITQILKSPYVSLEVKNELLTEGTLNKDNPALTEHLKEMEIIIEKLGPTIVNALKINDQGNMFGFTSRLMDPAAAKKFKKWKKLTNAQKTKLINEGKVDEKGFILDKKGNRISGEYFQAKEDIINRLPVYKDAIIPGVNPSDVAIMNKMVPGIFQDAIKQIAKGEQITPELAEQLRNSGNTNIALFKHLVKEMKTLVNNGKISKVGAIQFFQSQTNLVKGTRGLSKTELVYILKGENPSSWFDSTGKATTLHPLYSDAVKYYKDKGIKNPEAAAIKNLTWKGEHISPSANTNADIIDIIFNNNLTDAQVDLALNEILEGHNQLIAPKFITDMLDDGGRTSRDEYDRISNNLKAKYINNIFSIDGKSFKEFKTEKDSNKNILKASKDIKLDLDASHNAMKANNTINKYVKTGKTVGVSIFDFDDTLAKTKSGVRARVPNNDGKAKPKRKVIFLAGGAGSGKGNVVSKLNLEKQGFKIVNQDISLEWLKKNHGLPENMNNLTKEQRSILGKLSHQARGIAKRKMMKYQGNADGVVVDGTGASSKNMQKLVDEFKAKGYDVSMVFVETSLDVALQRNRARKERSLLDIIVKRNHESVMSNKQIFKTLFGDTFMEVNTDNLTIDSPMPSELVDKMKKFTTSYERVRLDAEEFAEQGSKILEQGGEFDFSEFNEVIDGTPGPLLDKAKERIKKFGNKDIFVLTARPAESAQPIHEFLKSQGLNVPIENITGLANSTGNAKASWILQKFAEGYNDIYFADDALQNVEAVKHVLDQLDVKSDVVQAKLKASKDLDIDFNEMLDRTKGVLAGKRFSAAEARIRGQKAGRFSFLVPPSAEDFKGLIYSFLGKGKQGDADLKFFKENLFDPYAKGIRTWNTYKQTMSNEYKDLLKTLPKTGVLKQSFLRQQVPDTNFTNDHAVRVYLWNKNGMDIPGISQALQNKLINHVKNNTDLLNFADKLSTISRVQEGYVQPGNYWTSGNIAMDLASLVGDKGRMQFLSKWKDNIDIVFSEANLNKIEAVYGTNFRDALENMMHRMTTGRNRTQGQDKNVNKFLNWINGSVGAVMFFNIRSATLQTISTVNFINWGDNNIFAASKAFANQKQFWKDFSMIFNSPMLKQRRAGLQIDVSASELTKAFSQGKGKPQAIISWLLEKGFTPTQIADSFAISMGGASFYRNRFNKYVKEGMTKEEANKQAFLDFQEIAEETQQSSRPDLISQQQAGTLGRLILAWQNTPMQMTRLTWKAVQDLVNGRGDMKTNISKIIYYGAVQNLIFGSMQSGLMFALFGDDDEEDDLARKEQRVANGMLDTLLRGTGIYGSAIATLKNVFLKWREEKQKDSWRRDDAKILIEAINLSPPMGSKLRKLNNAIKTEKWNQGVGKELGWRIENPNLSAASSLIEGLTNAPVDRLVRKANHIEEALTGNLELYQRMALMAGWDMWSIGIRDEELEEAKEKAKQTRKEEKKQEKIDKKNQEKEDLKKQGYKDVRCSGINSSGKQCSLTTFTKEKSWKCMHHMDFKDGMDRDGDGIKEYRCTATKTNGERCKNKTENKNKKCYAHQ